MRPYASLFKEKQKALNFSPPTNTGNVQKPKLIYVMYLHTFTDETIKTETYSEFNLIKYLVQS